jgi:hypothetical protein
MHLRNKRPIFVPESVFDELDKMPKAMLMDIAWNLAAAQAESADDAGAVRVVIRREAQLVKQYRKAERS